MSHVRMTDGRRNGVRRAIDVLRGRSGGRGPRGLSTVEMALVLTLLLMFVLGIVEYGWMLLKYQETTGAARQGTRMGAPFSRTNQDVRDAVLASMESAGLANSDYQICIGTPENPCSADGDTVDLMDLNPGDLFEVRIALPYKDGVGFNMPLVPVPEFLRTRLTMVREGI